MAYKISFKKSVAKDLSRIDKSKVIELLENIQKDLSIEADKYPPLKGQYAGLRKYRHGKFRVIFVVLNEEVIILRIDNRKDVYKK